MCTNLRYGPVAAPAGRGAGWGGPWCRHDHACDRLGGEVDPVEAVCQDPTCVVKGGVRGWMGGKEVGEKGVEACGCMHWTVEAVCQEPTCGDGCVGRHGGRRYACYAFNTYNRRAAVPIGL